MTSVAHTSSQTAAPQPVDDATFATMVRKWIVGFHGEVAPYPDSVIEDRVRTYIKQEDLYTEKVAYLLASLPSRPKTALDIGSSAGGLSVALAREGLTVHGIEPSLAGVEVSQIRAQRLGVSNISFQEGVGEKIPFADDSFDLVISIAVLEHVQNVKAVVSETFRVLKPGAYAYFEVPNNLFPFEGHYKMAWLPMMPKSWAKTYVRLRGAYPSFLNHLHYMNRFIVSRAFKDAGFTDAKDMYGDFLYGKAVGAPWTMGGGRLSKYPWLAPLVRLFFGALPTAWFANRAVFLLAKKPEA